MHTARRRLTAWALGILLVAGVLVSAWFLVREVRHTCTGPHCTTCAWLQWAAGQLRSGARPQQPGATSPARSRGLVLCLGGGVRTLPGDTLVSCKVRLDN